MIMKDNMKRLARLLSVSFLLLVSLSCTDKASLSRSYEELPLGSIRPEGWLKEMLVRQRDGISANLDETYPQVMGARNGWLGGDGDQWERGPYWIDGLLPMAYVLDDDALKEKVKPWIEWALASQKEDGSFGPDTDYPHESGLQRSNSRDWWPRMVVLKVLQQHYNATGAPPSEPPPETAGETAGASAPAPARSRPLSQRGPRIIPPTNRARAS